MASLCICEDLPEPLLLADAVITEISCNVRNCPNAYTFHLQFLWKLLRLKSPGRNGADKLF